MSDNYLLSVKSKAEAGDLQAQYYLSVMYEEGRGVERDPALSHEWCTRAAQGGDRQSQYRLAKILETGRGLPKAKLRAAWYWLEKAATAGHTQARFELGLRHLFGSCGVRQSYVRARKMAQCSSRLRSR